VPGRGSDGPYESEARDRVAGRLARLEAEAAERVAPTPVLHVIQDPGARTRQYLARLLPALAQGDVTRAGAVATTAERSSDLRRLGLVSLSSGYPSGPRHGRPAAE